MLWNYLRAVPQGRLQLAIVGKDPFPTSATGIPFCKATWEEQLAKNCSGRYVLGSLGVALGEARVDYRTPEELFAALRDVGIVFLNASYKYLGPTPIRRNHMPLLEQAHEVNTPILREANYVMYCGEAKKVRCWLDPVESAEQAKFVIHPDVRNRNNPRTRDEWKAAWAGGAIGNAFRIILPPKRRAISGDGIAITSSVTPRN